MLEKVFQGRFLSYLLIALLVTASFFSQNLAAKPFIWMIETGYTHTPDFEALGFTPLEVIYEQDFYSGKVKIRDRHEIKPHYLNKVANTVGKIDKTYIILDIENWLVDWHKQKPVEQQRIVQRYISTFNEVKNKNPDKKIGYFRVVPTWIHPKKKFSKIEKQVQRENQSRNPVAETVDVLYPSLYTYHSTYRDWAVWAKNTIDVARSLAPEKPVIVFLMPRFHPSSQLIVNHERKIPREFWGQQLAFVYEHADGAVIWDGARGGRGRWNEAAPWWVETRAFLSQLKTLSAQAAPLGNE